MKRFIANTGAILGAIALTAGVTAAQYQSDVEDIESVLAAYETALNASDTESVLTLYSKDGVFMPQHSPSQVGAEALAAAYTHVFNMINLTVEFEVEEIKQISPDWAFARTNSTGTVKVLSSGEQGPEANQELFVFHKNETGNWKIARYAFSSTNPPRQ